MNRIGRRSLAAGLALALLLAGCTPGAPRGQAIPAPPSEPAPTVSAAAPPSSPYFAQPVPHPAPGAARQGRNPAHRRHRSGKQAGLGGPRRRRRGLFRPAGRAIFAGRQLPRNHAPEPAELSRSDQRNQRGITSDCKPKSCTADVPSIADGSRSPAHMENVRREHAGSLRRGGPRALRGKAQPFVYYPSVTGDKASCSDHVVPLTDWTRICSRSPPSRTTPSSAPICATTRTTVRSAPG